MPPIIAAILFALAITGLFILDRDPKSQTSKALWIPVIWVFIICSRPVSMWLNMTQQADSVDQYANGSPVDAAVWGVLMAAGIIVLARRWPRVKTILRANKPILFFLAYCAISVSWSAYSLIAFKRWTKAVGDLVMVLVVLSDRDRSSAIKRLITRTGFLLIPLSVLFIKYFPELGRRYEYWTFTPEQVGITIAKNQLGMICLLIGLGSLWRLLSAYQDKSRPYMARRREMVAHGAILVMVLWLFRAANSITSLACFVLAGGLMIVTSLSRRGRKPAFVHFMIVTVICGSLATLFLDPAAAILEALGRDPTLTGRTAIWGLVLKVAGNPIVGTGYESFWLGDRLQQMRAMKEYINESHNGYLEVFLNLGWVGVSLLAVVLVNGYRNVLQTFRRNRDTGRLMLAFFVTVLIYNLTEAAFKELNPIWFFFLLAITVVPEPKLRERHRSEPTAPMHALFDSAYATAMPGSRRPVSAFLT